MDIQREYDLVQLIGEGWFSRVYLAERRSTREEVSIIIKIIKIMMSKMGKIMIIKIMMIMMMIFMMVIFMMVILSMLEDVQIMIAIEHNI